MTRRTFISCVSRDAQRVVKHEEESEKEEKKEYQCEEGTQGQGGDKRNSRTSQQCGIWRVLVLISTSLQHAMQFSCRLHHQSVSHMKLCTELFGCSLARLPPLADPPTHSCPSQSFHFARKCPQCPLSDYFFLFLFLNLIPFYLFLLIFQHILTLSFSLIFGSKRQRYSTSFLSVAGHKLQASPDVSGPPRREIRGILSSGIACAYPPNSPLHSLFFHLHLRFHYHYLLFFLLLFLPCSAFCQRGTRRY